MDTLGGCGILLSHQHTIWGHSHPEKALKCSWPGIDTFVELVMNDGKFSRLLPFLSLDECQDIRSLTEAQPAKQPFAIDCTSPLLTTAARATWYRHPSEAPVSTDRQARVHQEQSWILFLPLAWGDSGTYRCLIK